MSSLNIHKDSFTEVNSVGTPVRAISKEAQLTRMTLAHMLWEDQFYIDGISSAKIMSDLVKECKPEFVKDLAIKARTSFKLRHVPLLLAREVARHGQLRADDLNSIIQRPDEMSEFVSIYWKDKKEPISHQVKLGLAKAFKKFNEYSLAKWDKNSAAVSLRDVMFMVHPKPDNVEQEALFKRIANKELKTPDTWEVQLSAGADKKETFERLMANNNLGALAFLRNLRNMVQAGVDNSVIRAYASQVNVDRVLPFRFIAAARIMPQFEDMLEAMMFRGLVNLPKLPGRTVLVIDTSGSMGAAISGKSDLSCIDAACALAILARELCEDVVIYATAGDDDMRKHATMLIPPRRGFALADFIKSREVSIKIGGGGIFLLQCMDYITDKEKANNVDRVIVFTDEQDTGGRGFEHAKAKRLGKGGKNYIMNVGADQNGVNSRAWHTITGFSEASLDYIRAFEENQ